MKLLLVFVSVLVFVAQGKVLTPGDLVRANTFELQPGAPEELRNAEQQPGAYAVADEAIRVFGAAERQNVGSPQESQRAYEVASPEFRQFDAGVERGLPKTLNLPSMTGTCTESVCSYICTVLGYTNATCATTAICQCTNS